MKRFVVIILFGLLCIGAAQAQTQWYKATEFALKVVDTEWSDWISVNISIKFDMDKDIIIIYSNETQIYKILELVDPPYDPGGVSVKFRVIDQDYDKGSIRLRVQNDGNSQIYVDFADVSWVYNVIKYK